MKIIKSILISGFLTASFLLTSCNENPKDNSAGTFSPARYSSADSISLKNAGRDSVTAINDTITTPASRSDEKKNNPDITK